jgi:glycosyltransferase involved in cell wall biosynthesis
MSSIAVVILTFNEEKHLARCLESVKSLTDKIYIIDSYSTDKTKAIAESFGATFTQHKWENNHARQFNWGLESLQGKHEWVLRLDADEYLLPELVEEIKQKIPNLENEITGVILKRRVLFMKRWIKHGGYYPIHLLRLWKMDAGKFEDRWMDEHVKLNYGKVISFENDFVDENLNNLSWWTDKHNNYATREAIDLLNIKYKFFNSEKNPELGGKQDKRKRWIKEKVYTNVPLFIRPIFYFAYRYFIRLGFLDGIPGIIWHFLQGFWYRFLVDAKVYQIEQIAKKENKTIPEVIKEHYGIEIGG